MIYVMPNCELEHGFVFELDNFFCSLFMHLHANMHQVQGIFDSFRRKSLHNRFLKIQQVNFVSAVQSSLSLGELVHAVHCIGIS